ncbi:MAG: bifunctional diaminohydroxyphosphoribosylaminopyrimidine deaminase/5-amino-6-(5-phosphoribosylamino)uracil reductase RibD [Lachnospiraceae bacterium]|nr:bifunctional diaminohydroxyphosphoribosylaminopyrimidine deaminase/5-amino-6-(5-phosphoribosylamino)uracil reductase RibD [Lachnospiraceae bacterium]
MKEGKVLDSGFDEKYMRLALKLAERGCGKVNPNPMVGAVIVKDGKVIAGGYHTQYGHLHAEREAFAALKNPEDAAGADLYVTLEPCCHQGKQPPCTEAILEHKIARVFVGSSDPNPLVAGKGVSMLREHGVRVTEHVLEEECSRLNEVFFHYIKTKQPYVVMKYAMTMDGKIATVSGKSRWITGETARRRVHEDRNRYTGIMVGIQTVLKDDPMLNCRLEGGRNPVRIVCDSSLRIPEDSQLVKSAGEIPLWIAAVRPEKNPDQAADVKKASEEEKNQMNTDWKASRLEAAGCRILYVDADENGHVDLSKLMGLLGQEGIDSILLEGGAQLHESALRSRIVNKVQAYIAPKLFGGKGAPSPLGGCGVDAPDEAWMLSKPVITVLDPDLLLESEVIYPCLQES